MLKIINTYGISKQLKYIHSEYFELDDAILNYIYKDENKYQDREHITEELADVTVMLKQFQYYYDITDEQVENIMVQKIERQLKRIEKEKEGNMGSGTKR